MLGLMSAYKENRSIALVAAIIQTLMYLYWLSFLIACFIGGKGTIRKICIDNRCPDHLWIQDSRWRPFSGVCDPADLTLPHLSKTEGQAALTSISASNNYTNGLNIIAGHNITLDKIMKDRNVEQNGTGPIIWEFVGVQDRLWVSQSGMGSAAYFAGSIVLSILIGLYMVYCITTLLSYRYELKMMERIER